MNIQDREYYGQAKNKEHSTYASTEFLKVVQKKLKYKIECVQTDNGFEFTNRLNSHETNKKTMFEEALKEAGIEHKLIKPKTPRHNGKVERSHIKYFVVLRILRID